MTNPRRRALCHEALGRLDLARRDAERARALEPHFAAALALLERLRPTPAPAAAPTADLDPYLVLGVRQVSQVFHKCFTIFFTFFSQVSHSHPVFPPGYHTPHTPHVYYVSRFPRAAAWRAPRM